jgi:hypothetical protein
MADVAPGTILAALLNALAAQGFGAGRDGGSDETSAYPVHGTLNVQALADAVENALGGGDIDDDAKSAAELNAANDG